MRSAWLLLVLSACGAGEEPATELAPVPVPVPASAPAQPSGAAEAPVPVPVPTPAPVAAAELAGEAAAADPPPVHTSTLRPVAFREGRIELWERHGALVTMLDGEPWTWRATTPSRAPNAGLGLEPIEDEDVMSVTTWAVGGDLEGGGPAWQTLEWDYPRNGSSFTVHHRQGDRWVRVDHREGSLVAYYTSYVERDGALLALRSWAPHPDELRIREEWEEDYRPPSEEPETPWPGLAWIQLSGPPIALPKITRETPVRRMITTSDGIVYGLDDGLFRWRTGSTSFEHVSVPGLYGSVIHGFFPSGEWVVLHGSRSVRGKDDIDREVGYLVVGRDEEWTRIPTPRPKTEYSLHGIIAAARAPDGELWIALGHQEGVSEADPVWRKPPDGEWERVPLPPFRAVEPSTPWVYTAHRVHRDELDRGTDVYSWKTYEAPTYDTTFVYGMTWAAGAIWVTVAQHDDVWFRGPPRLRAMLLTTLQGEGEPVVLPPPWQLQLERRNERARTAALGSRDCRAFSLVVGPASLATTQPELVRALRAMPRAGRGKLGPIYVGELDGTPRLVAYARAPTVDAAHALRDAASAATGLDVTTDCRVPLVDTMVSRGRSM